MGTDDRTGADPLARTAVHSRRRARALIGRLLLVASAIAVTGGGMWLVDVAGTPTIQPLTIEIPARDVPAVAVRPGSLAPADNLVAAPGTPAGAGVDPLRGWAERLAGPTSIPVRALLAYGNAHLTLRAADPACQLSWPTLAAIGRIESNHGRYGGAVLGDDGRPSKPIIGIPLDGSPGVRTIGDTDHGALDGDSAADRAVGPMQFIPSTWRVWSSDGNLDGLGDPHQIDDAALAAARYLCARDRNMATAAGWWAGVLSYNNSVSYAQKVFGLADGYARSAEGLG